MAETIPARWPALSRILAVVLVVGSLIVPAASASASGGSPGRTGTAAVAEDGLILQVAPAGSGVVQPGQDLLVSATIRNATTATVGAGTLRLYLTAEEITGRDDLGKWLGPDHEGVAERQVASQQLTTQLLPGEERDVTITVPAASVGLDKDAWGTRGIEATFTVAGANPVSGRSTIVWNGGTAPTGRGFAMVVPITVPPTSDGLIPADDLATYTSPFGILSAQLDGVFDRPIVIGMDPMIIASIRVLGSSAPPSAVAWLDRLSHAKNDIFPLAYADSDIALEARADVKSVLDPTTFQQAIDPTDFPSPTAATPSSTPTESTPGKTAAPEPELPSGTEDVLAWDYTATDIAWPAPGSVTAENLDFFAASNLTTTIVSDSELSGTEDAPATATLGRHAALVTDELLSTAIRRAAVASSDREWRQAVADAQAQLALLAGESSSPAMLLASIDRATARTATRLGATIDALLATTWIKPATLDELRASTSAWAGTLNTSPVDTERAGHLGALLAREKQITAFASALANPAALTGEYRLHVLALLATSWRGEPDEWQHAVADSLKKSAQTLDAVTITTEGPFLVVASQTDIPITLSNDLEQAVTVRVQLAPSNGRLLVDQETETTIDAESAKTILVPVTAKVGNGSVILHISVHSPTGVAIAEPKTVSVNVQAEWEGIGAVIFGILVVLFFSFGVWRNITRRRRERDAQAVESAEPESAADEGAAHEPAAGPEETRE